jgi:hypothetical protein
MQNESWWKQDKSEKSNFRTMLLYLLEILKLKQTDSYELACGYIVEIFRYEIFYFFDYEISLFL